MNDLWSSLPKAQLEAACLANDDGVAGVRSDLSQRLTRRLGLLQEESDRRVHAYVTTQCAAMGLKPDQDRPDEAMSVGQSATVDGVEIEVSKFVRVHPQDPLAGYDYVGAYVSLTNRSDGPKETLGDVQFRLENPYVATVQPLTSTFDLKEGAALPFGAFRPGTSVEGWVAWAVSKDSELLKSFGVYYTSMTGEEAVWWISYFKR